MSNSHIPETLLGAVQATAAALQCALASDSYKREGKQYAWAADAAGEHVSDSVELLLIHACDCCRTAHVALHMKLTISSRCADFGLLHRLRTHKCSAALKQWQENRLCICRQHPCALRAPCQHSRAASNDGRHIRTCEPASAVDLCISHRDIRRYAASGNTTGCAW